MEPGVTPVLAASRRYTRAHRTLAPRLPDVRSQPSLAERLDSLRPYEPVSRVSPAVSRLLWTAIRCQRGLLCPLGEGRVSVISRAFECRCGGSGEPPDSFNGLVGRLPKNSTSGSPASRQSVGMQPEAWREEHGRAARDFGVSVDQRDLHRSPRSRLILRSTGQVHSTPTRTPVSGAA